ncbi:hypothetical protein MCOR02_001352 [Pyricularia oryzae]|uniref:Uncharacterized protein n=5 Tax=Pyricularia TaxID=48558 RepID=A0ABQ8NZU7_PYRGI|nr:uncharacterized protein MGG_04353 [Pyricularia oryzae 70-15]ELQ33248.1 hypothetical protein OOU_Y34scaffold00979g31 [Pyricularia oryzae Y34]KAH8837616.1 hypothetical protein MCOR01_011223 [Pyricularia oryzae]KAI6303237.1 hypothetical protein MCOR33_001503 [Pyricularia grisea]EHA53656.1 hypothetical protein MGG_04353 [Pyricularia oryzae 70-15]KAH9437699.1 hypothetical protein MCOR02_001352 [Pyricularia oryzae]
MSGEPNATTGGEDHNTTESIPHRHYTKVHTGQTRHRKQSRGFFSAAMAKLGLGRDVNDNQVRIADATGDVQRNILIICDWKWAKARRHGRSHIGEQLQAVRFMEVLLQNGKVLCRGFEARDGLTPAQIDDHWKRAGGLICQELGGFERGRDIQGMIGGQS